MGYKTSEIAQQTSCMMFQTVDIPNLNLYAIVVMESP